MCNKLRGLPTNFPEQLWRSQSFKLSSTEKYTHCIHTVSCINPRGGASRCFQKSQSATRWVAIRPGRPLSGQTQNLCERRGEGLSWSRCAEKKILFEQRVGSTYWGGGYGRVQRIIPWMTLKKMKKTSRSNPAKNCCRIIHYFFDNHHQVAQDYLVIQGLVLIHSWSFEYLSRVIWVICGYL